MLKIDGKIEEINGSADKLIFAKVRQTSIQSVISFHSLNLRCLQFIPNVFTRGSR
jgi:hypothetical protein